MDGFRPKEIHTFGGLVSKVPPEDVPVGFAVQARNVIYVGKDARTRPGLTQTIQSIGANAPVTGFGILALGDEDATKIPVLFLQDGRLEKEKPVGSGATEEIGAGIGLGSTQYAQMSSAFGRLHIAVSDLVSPQTIPLLYHKYNDIFHVDPVGCDPCTAKITSPMSSGTLGDIAVGTRYMLTLYVTRTGYISGVTSAAVTGVTISAPDQAIVVTIPISPDTNVVSRIVAFTQAGASSDGPYYWIGEDFSIDGLNALITKTTVPGNGLSTQIFNFTDEYLVSTGLDVTNYFNKLRLPPQINVFFSKGLKRFIWTGETENIFRLSEVNDPETYLATTGFIQPGDRGDRAIGAVEWQNSTYLLKENSGFLVQASNLDPVRWSTPQKWEKTGPCSYRAYDSCDEFFGWVHKSGFWIYQGGLAVRLSDGNQGSDEALWSSINWAKQHLIWMTIDPETKAIYIGVPTHESTVPDSVIYISYEQGLDKTQWSLWAGAAYASCLRIPRTLQGTPPIDSRLLGSQLVFASAAPDGIVNMLDPLAHSDNGGPIHSIYQCAYVDDGSALNTTLGGIEVHAKGSGQLVTEAHGNGAPKSFRAIDLTSDFRNYLRPIRAGAAPQWSISFSNNNVAGAWFEVRELMHWVRPHMKQFPTPI